MKVYDDPAGEVTFVPETPEDERILGYMTLWPCFYPAERLGHILTLVPSEQTHNYAAWLMPLTAWIEKEIFGDEVLLPINEAVVPKLLSSLTAREKRILEMWLGVKEQPKTLKTIGLAFGISGNRAQQIKNKAGRKIRWQLHNSKLLEEKTKD